jgi:hypothetical protein
MWSIKARWLYSIAFGPPVVEVTVYILRVHLLWLQVTDAILESDEISVAVFSFRSRDLSEVFRFIAILTGYQLFCCHYRDVNGTLCPANAMACNEEHVSF